MSSTISHCFGSLPFRQNVFHSDTRKYNHLTDYYQFNFSLMQLSNQLITWQLLKCIKGCGLGQDNLLNSKLNVRMGKKGDLSNFECDMVVGARQAGLSISQSAQLLGFSNTTISSIYKWCEKGKTSSMRQYSGRKCLVNARGQRRMG